MRSRISFCMLLLIWFASPDQMDAQISEFRSSLNELKNSWDAEQEAIKQIKKLGGWVELADCVPAKWHNQIPEGKRKFVVEVNMVYHYDKETGARSDNSNESDKCLEAIGKLTQIKKIFLKGGQATDETMKHVANLKQVEVFFVWDASKVSDKGLKHLSNYRKLKNVHLSNSKITEKGISYLSNSNDISKLSLQGNPFSNEIFNVASRFKKLESLWVGRGNNTIDDKGLTKYLPKLKNLKTLGIQTIQGTDEGLRVAYKLPRLEEVYASGNSISPDEVQRLQDHAKKNKEKSKANKADNNEKSKAKKTDGKKKGTDEPKK